MPLLDDSSLNKGGKELKETRNQSWEGCETKTTNMKAEPENTEKKDKEHVLVFQEIFLFTF